MITRSNELRHLHVTPERVLKRVCVSCKVVALFASLPSAAPVSMCRHHSDEDIPPPKHLKDVSDNHAPSKTRDLRKNWGEASATSLIPIQDRGREFQCNVAALSFYILAWQASRRLDTAPVQPVAWAFHVQSPCGHSFPLHVRAVILPQRDMA
ncbi:hypothetical protein BDY17DRAFT_192298 [Neohortaea acidophila]|uniref:Uncharacterized protein n=1 Tax=Neohortaea acidophila TaxID=245834 RepID=A0A6A6PK28_9PEZI|nr:uncharacterized protein BDY17DRAFT_192298 [Neohortaea acidophila]KAF2480410.1 hypothetical protein BDY17DRAFT_192298 [Neohortaea acidophila]